MSDTFSNDAEDESVQRVTQCGEFVGTVVMPRTVSLRSVYSSPTTLSL